MPNAELNNISRLQNFHPLKKYWPKEMQALTNFSAHYNAGPGEFYRDAKLWTAPHDARTKEIRR